MYEISPFKSRFISRKFDTIGFVFFKIDITVGTEKTAFHFGNVFCVLVAHKIFKISRAHSVRYVTGVTILACACGMGFNIVAVVASSAFYLALRPALKKSGLFVQLDAEKETV